MQEKTTPKPKLSVSGYRGIWGTDLTEQIAFEYARAFAKFVANQDGSKIKKVLIGRDGRKSGPQILSSIKKALQAEGIEATYAGILPTPTILLLVNKLGFDAGVMITASHNPIAYNGIKFIVEGGRLTNEAERDAIQKNFDALSIDEKNLIGETIPEEQPDSEKMRKIHIDEIFKNIDVELIKSKKFKVALDPINSGGSIITQEMLRLLGCEVHVINGEMTGDFAHVPEPLPENLEQIAKFTKEQGCDIGFAQDPDADRLIVVSEQGVVISEEYTLVLSIKNVLSKQKGNVVVNLSTSKMCEDVVNEYGQKLYRSKVGEANVLQKMLETNAVIGGEGSSGAIYPTINTARDSLVGIALILELLARENKKISEIVENLPKYFMKKEKWPRSGNLDEIYTKLKSHFSEAIFNEEDGLRLDLPDHSWIHFRPSITEPIVRLFGEAKTKERIDGLFEEAKLTLGYK